MANSNIFGKFLESRPDIVDLFEEFDISSTLLNSKKLINGFTFLVPNNTYVKKISALGAKDEEVAVSRIMDLILPIPLSSIREWTSNKDDIPNMHNRKLQITNITNDGIALEGGAILLPLRYRTNEPVYFYEVTKAPVNTGKGKSSRKVSSSTTKKQLDSASTNVRVALYDSLGNCKDIYNLAAHYCGSFLKWLSKNDNGLYVALIPLLDYCPITTFTILFEPYKNAHYLLADNVINKWYDEMGNGDCSVFLMQTLQSHITCNAHSADYIREVNEVRQDLLDESLPKKIGLDINSIYDDLVFNNRVGSLGSVLPVATHTLLKSKSSKNYNIKLFQDELRFNIEHLVNETLSTKSVLTEIRSMLKLLPKFNDQRIITASSKDVFVNYVHTFSNTTYLLYVAPYKDGEFGGIKAQYDDIDVDGKYYDLVSKKIIKLKNIVNKPLNNDEVLEQFVELIEKGQISHIPKSLHSKIKSMIDT
jgi:hypothetical protein